MRRLRQNLQHRVQELAALREAFSDGDGPIPEAYTRAYVEQMESLRAERAGRGAGR